MVYEYDNGYYGGVDKETQIFVSDDNDYNKETAGFGRFNNEVQNEYTD